MASLATSNKYLKNRKRLLKMIGENSYDSAVFEGASPRSLKTGHCSSSSRRSIAASKKATRSA